MTGSGDILVERLRDRSKRPQELLRELWAFPRVLVKPRIGAAAFDPRYFRAFPWTGELPHDEDGANDPMARRI